MIFAYITKTISSKGNIHYTSRPGAISIKQPNVTIDFTTQPLSINKAEVGRIDSTKKTVYGPLIQQARMLSINKDYLYTVPIIGSVVIPRILDFADCKLS